MEKGRTLGPNMRDSVELLLSEWRRACTVCDKRVHIKELSDEPPKFWLNASGARATPHSMHLLGTCTLRACCRISKQNSSGVALGCGHVWFVTAALWSTGHESQKIVARKPSHQPQPQQQQYGRPWRVQCAAAVLAP